MKIRLGEFFLDKLIIDRTKLAAVDAFQATDTLRAVGFLVYFDIDRTILPAFVAQGALILIRDHSEEANPVEQGKDRTKRTRGPAEWAFAHNHPNQKQDQNRKFPGEQETKLSSDIWADGRQRNSGFKGASRTDPFAEPCLTESKLIHDKKRQEHDKHRENDVLHVSQIFRDPEFLGFDFIQKLLEKSKRAEPPARHPAHQAADGTEKTDHVEPELILGDREVEF